MNSYGLLWLIPVLPLCGAIINGLLGKKVLRNRRLKGRKRLAPTTYKK